MSQGGVDQWTQSGGTAVSLFVAQWEANQGKADAVVAKLRRFLPQAQSEPNVKLFLIGQGNDNPAQLLFCELFESRCLSHQASEYFKSIVEGQALPLLSKRERRRYSLL